MTRRTATMPRSVVAGRSSSQIYAEIEAGFDAEWYAGRYLADDASRGFRADPFTHYLVHGMAAAHSPNAEFDEGFYRAFYREIADAIAAGTLSCGFYHYVAAGRREGRLPRYERRSVLEARIPGVTRPTLLERLPEIRARLRPPMVRSVPDAASRVWVMLPTINPDIAFGGYRGVLELMRGLRRVGHPVTVLCTEDSQASQEYFVWREESETLRALMRDVDVRPPSPDRLLEVGPHDTVLVYSLWDLYAADHIRRMVETVRVVLLLQEYEPIFYDHCSARAVAESAYALPHYALINSAFLARYLRTRRIGVFGRTEAPVLDRDFRVFEHRINRLAEQSASQMASRRERVLIAYARPEAHASRNMFELLILALQLVCEEGLFGPEWHFIGLGALIDMEPIELGGGHRMVMHAKMTEERYTTYISMMDVGISLMYAPHPSVMPFEFATTGALVVTNTYENRSAADLAAVSGNIIAGPPSIEGIATALREAVTRVPDVASRVANIFRPSRSSWTDIFDDELIRVVFGEPATPASSVHASRAAPVVNPVRQVSQRDAARRPPRRPAAARGTVPATSVSDRHSA